MVDDFDHIDPWWRGAEAKGRPKAAAALRAREIVEQANWLWRPLIYWDGIGPSREPSVAGIHRPLAQVIIDRLTKRPPNLYFVNTGQPVAWGGMKGDNFGQQSVLPAILEIIPVDPQFLAGVSYQAFVASRRFPRALPELVGDISRWRNEVSARLGRLRVALDASRGLASQEVKTLVLEGTCLWLGSEARRPSGLLPTETIRDCLMQGDGSGPGQILAAVVLGQRKVATSLPPNLRIWRNLGKLFARWPPDLLAALPEADLGQILKAVRACAWLNSQEAWHTAIEFRLISAHSSLAALLAALPPFLESLHQHYLEPQRRWGKLAQHLALALDRSPVVGLSQSLADVLRETGEDRGLDFPCGESFLQTVNSACRWFLGSELPGTVVAELSRKIESVGRKFRIPGLRRRLDQWPPAIPGDQQEDVWSACRKAIMEPLVTLRQTPLDERPWNLVVSSLAGHLAAQGDARRSLARLAGWLDSCRMWAPIWEGQALRLATMGLSQGLSGAESREDLEGFLGTLSHHGATLLSKEFTSQFKASSSRVLPALSFDALWKGLSGKLSILGRLGMLGDEQLEQIVAEDLYDAVGLFLPANRPALPGFLDWLRSNPRACSPFWAQVFLLETPGVAPILGRWVQRLVSGGIISWQVAEELVRNLFWRFFDLAGDGEGKQRQAFLVQTFWVVERLVPGNPPSGNESELFAHRVRLVEIAYQWEKNGYPDLPGLFDALLGFCTRQEAERQKKTPWNEELLLGDELGLAVKLAGGHPGRLLILLEYLAPEWKHPEDPEAGWRFLASWPAIQAFLSDCTGHADRVPRVFHLLKRLALLARLPSRDWFGERMQIWGAPPISSQTLPPEARAFAIPLTRLCAYRGLAGYVTPFPDIIEKVLNRQSAQERERELLERKEAEGELSPSARLRLDKLRSLRLCPEQLVSWMERDLSDLVVEQEQVARLEALETMAREGIRRHWQTILGPVKADLESPDWDNALHLWHSVNRNRRLLKQLLQHEARGDRQWIVDRPLNRRFLEETRQNNMQLQAWLGPMERHYAVPGGERWTVRVEADPLKVLWMGRLFGTCLSPGDVNAYSTIANAVEVNKCVLYLDDCKGRIIGRKLLAMNSKGVVFGFRSYGAGGPGGGSPWVKILLDMFSLDLVVQTGARFPTTEEEQTDEAQFHLFARWYFDGYEPFDQWVKDLSLLADRSLEARQQALVDNLMCCLREKAVEFARDDGETIRALFWLGPEAEPIIQEAIKQGALSPEQVSLLNQHGDRPASESKQQNS